MLPPSKRPKSYILQTSSRTLFPPTTSYTGRPKISEKPTTPRSQPQAVTVQTPLFHVPNPETVTKFVDCKQPTATKTARLQPQKDILHILDTEYPTILHFPSSETGSSTKSQIYPTLN